ncbi:MAG TPA: hypothetical protein VK179_07015 [Bacteroidales bacterium]|nr:hypothetical protein [Bacteroidales bacterium]
MRIIFNVVLLLIISITISAQSEIPVTKRIGFSAGFQNRILLDEQKSALVYRSGEYLAGLSFDRCSDRSFFSVSLEGSTGTMMPKYLGERWLYITSYDINGSPEIDSFPLMAQLYNGIFQFTYMRVLNNSENLSWLAGFSVKDYLVYPDNYTGLFNSLGIHIKAGFRLKTTARSVFRTDVSFPLIALNSRLPWHNTATDPLDSEIKTFFKKGTRLTGPDKLRLLEFSAAWDMQVSKHWALGASYGFNWLNVTYHQPMRSYVNSFRIQTHYTF